MGNIAVYQLNKFKEYFRRGGFMESVDIKKLETAIIYLQRIADGNNPINNLPAAEDSVLNNPNVIRCMFFVKDILEEVKKNGGYIGKKVKKNDKVDFPVDALNTFIYREDKSISRFEFNKYKSKCRKFNKSKC